MKTMSRALFFPAIAAGFCLISCATVSKVGKGSMALVHKTGEATSSGVSSLTSGVSNLSEMAVNKIHPTGGLKIVEVREKELKALPTGHERALAFENTRKRSSGGFWFFKGPVDFVEPTLPEPMSNEDVDILLPPKSE